MDKKEEHDPCCPYLAVAGGAGSRYLSASTRHRCWADGTERTVSLGRQTTSCLGPGFTRCPEYREVATDEEDEPEGSGWTISFSTSGSTLAEAALLCLMAGAIFFAIFSIAPRPQQEPLAQAAQSSSAGDAAGDTSTPLANAPATESPVPTPTPVPATQTPASAPTPTATVRPAGGTYVTKRGDTLFSIARANHVTVDALAKANSLSDPRQLRAGQKLRIP